MESLTARLQRKDFLLRLLLLVVALVAALLLANVAASLLAVWQLDPGATVAGPWNDLLDANQATQRSNTRKIAVDRAAGCRAQVEAQHPLVE